VGDPLRIRQIVRNLIVNAQRYGGTRRRVVLSVSNDRVALEMRDNGDPIPLQDRERIFEPYTRAHQRPGVTASVGLGLAVSRRLARRMGGELEYVHDGWEAIFRLTLPAAEPTPVAGTGWRSWSTARSAAEPS
jgi:signal transduction histidine kinase